MNAYGVELGAKRHEPPVEGKLTKCATRGVFEITLEAHRSRFVLECQVGLELPRTVFRPMSSDVGLMLAQALLQIVHGSDVEMTGYLTDSRM